MEELDEGKERKWALLAITYILQGLDPDVHHDRIVTTLETLAEIDTSRRGYYNDLLSKFVWEKAVCAAAQDGGSLRKGSLDMSNIKLTTTYYLGHFYAVESLDLSRNRILKVAGIQYLQSLRRLVLDENEIGGVYDESLRSLPHLEFVSLKNNTIRSLRGLEGLVGLSSLTALYLAGNAVCNLAEYAEFAAKHLSYLQDS